MTERKAHFIESSKHDNPVEFDIMPLPDQEYLDAFNRVIEENPRNGFGTAEVKHSGDRFRALVWDREHTVAEDEDNAIKVANNVYGLQEHSEDHFRNILAANEITDPFTFRQLVGTRIKIPAVIPPEIIQGYVKEWVEKTNASTDLVSTAVR